MSLNQVHGIIHTFSCYVGYMKSIDLNIENKPTHNTLSIRYNK